MDGRQAEEQKNKDMQAKMTARNRNTDRNKGTYLKINTQSSRPKDRDTNDRLETGSMSPYPTSHSQCSTITTINSTMQ